MAGQSSKEGASFSILGIGDVEIKVVFNNVENTLTFRDALHAPDITANLLSISKMDVAGWHAMFGDQRVCFYKGKSEIFGGILKNGLYFVNRSFSMAIPTALTAQSLRSPTNLATWHC